MKLCVSDVVKINYVHRDFIQEIWSQKHLLSKDNIIAVSLIESSLKIEKISHFQTLLVQYTTNTSKDHFTSWTFDEIMSFKNDNFSKFNVPHHDVLITYMFIGEEDYYIEHQRPFDKLEIEELENIKMSF